MSQTYEQTLEQFGSEVGGDSTSTQSYPEPAVRNARRDPNEREIREYTGAKQWMPISDNAYRAVDTDGFSIAHLRELYVSVFCLGRNYEEVLNRLKVMAKQKFRSSGDFHISGIGKK